MHSISMEGTTTKTTQKRLATLVGCNYAGTPYELRGCINDVHAMRDLLVARFGFAPADVTVLTDDDDVVTARGAVQLPTGANVKRALADMVARAAAPGDVLFFHYSGHGTLVPPVTPDHRARRRDDEAIVPCDFNLITDVDFRRLVDRVPPGASFTVVSDSCHSCGLIDNEKEQIGPSSVDDDDLALTSAAVGSDTRTPAQTPTRTATRRARFIPYAAVVDHLSRASGVDASRHAADHLVALFGADASAKFFRHDDSAPTQPESESDDAGILLSGCQTDETSADVVDDEEEGGGGGDGAKNNNKKKACGAFSSAVQAVLAAHPAPLSNREVVSGARAVLSEQGFEQHPCLYCSDGNADAAFLCQQGALQDQEQEEEEM